MVLILNPKCGADHHGCCSCMSEEMGTCNRREDRIAFLETYCRHCPYKTTCGPKVEGYTLSKNAGIWVAIVRVQYDADLTNPKAMTSEMVKALKEVPSIDTLFIDGHPYIGKECEPHE